MPSPFPFLLAHSLEPSRTQDKKVKWTFHVVADADDPAGLAAAQRFACLDDQFFGLAAVKLRFVDHCSSSCPGSA
jgi:hypothetical protein